MRGVERMADPRVSGAVVGMVGATAFVLVNRSELPGPLPAVALAAWAVALAGCVYAVLLRDRVLPPAPAPRAGAGAVYGAAVAGMVAAIVLGSRALVAVDRELLVPALVVTAVGLHFVPFARAFRAPVFGRLGWALAALGVAGLVLGAAWPSTAAVAAVLAGLTMLGLVAADALRQG